MTNDELIKTVKQIIDGLNKETFHGAAMTLTERVTRYEELTAANPLTVESVVEAFQNETGHDNSTDALRAALNKLFNK